KIYNSVHLAPRKPDVLRLPIQGPARIIRLLPNELTTALDVEEVPTENGCFRPGNGLCKLAVLERHHASGRVGLGILRGFNLSRGAIATTVGHDSHNLVVCGDNDGDMLAAIDALEECGGGYAVVSGGRLIARLTLPVAGLMSDAPLETILRHQRELLDAARSLGIDTESDPFITLSFIALPVIPAVRLTDMGLFDVTRMAFFDQEN
ncbi:MAG: adenine deaminase C-terminal domain-containing protein, partial [Clostridia bacterium]|nr:adenine deaminase C-terminal domain-containing protein [Clostridia bacterium]